MTGMTKKEILTDPERCASLCEERGYNNLGFYHKGQPTIEEVEKLVKDKGDVDCVILDQLRNMRTLKDNSKVDNLELVAQRARDIGINHKVLVVSVTQAGATAENSLVLKMNDVDSSKTGIPGAVDVMIGIGCNNEFENSNKRMLSFPKNKISGKHGHFHVGIQPELSRMISL